MLSERRPPVDLADDGRENGGALLFLDRAEGAASAGAGLDPPYGVLKCAESSAHGYRLMCSSLPVSGITARMRRGRTRTISAN